MKCRLILATGSIWSHAAVRMRWHTRSKYISFVGISVDSTDLNSSIICAVGYLQPNDVQRSCTDIRGNKSFIFRGCNAARKPRWLWRWRGLYSAVYVAAPERYTRRVLILKKKLLLCYIQTI